MKMGDRSDFFRSLVRGFAEGAGKRLGLPLGWPAEVGARGSPTGVVRLGPSDHQGAHARGLRARGQRRCRDERIWIEATFDDGESVQISVAPLGARFAPRGAKEVLFHIEPEGMAGRARARDLVGRHCGPDCSRTLGTFLRYACSTRASMPSPSATASEVRVDLRSVPAVRAAHKKGLSQLFDMLELGSVGVVDGALRLQIKLPPLLA